MTGVSTSSPSFRDTVTRRLGKSGIEVSAIGCGCMGLTGAYGPAEPDESRAALRSALDHGITHFDTADVYDDGANEQLVGSVLSRGRSRVVIATKCGLVNDGGVVRRNGSPSHIRGACEASLRRLDSDYVDLLYLHRVDPLVPVEDSIGAMGELVREGKVRCLGLSKVDADTIARADTVHPIAAVQMQYSLWRSVDERVLRVCRARDIAVVAYSPLSKGLLSGRAKPSQHLDERDRRRSDPRFQPDALARHGDALAELAVLARVNACTDAQLALAWLLSREPNVLPIPGIRTGRHAAEDAAAMHVTLAQHTLRRLERFDIGQRRLL